MIPGLLYQRVWSLTLVPNGQPAAVYGSEGTRPSDVRVVFDVTRTLSGTKANKAKFAIGNLTSDNRNNILPGTMVILRAGYVASSGIVFRGYVSKVVSRQDGPDVVTELECEDGGPQLLYGTVQLSYSAPVMLSRVLQDVARGLSVELGGIAFALEGQIVQGIPKHQYKRLVKSGPCREILDYLLKPRGMTWSIQCGTLLIQNVKGVVNLVAEVLSKETGMLGVPSRTPTGVSCMALLNPRLTPGCAVRVLSQNPGVSGDFRAVRCVYKGDTEGNEWSVNIDGQALLAPLAPVPTTQQADYADAEVGEDADPEAGLEP